MITDGTSFNREWIHKHCVDDKGWALITDALERGTIDHIKAMYSPVKELPKKELKKHWYDRVPWVPVLVAGLACLTVGAFGGLVVGLAVP